MHLVGSLGPFRSAVADPEAPVCPGFVGVGVGFAYYFAVVALAACVGGYEGVEGAELEGCGVAVGVLHAAWECLGIEADDAVDVLCRSTFWEWFGFEGSGICRGEETRELYDGQHGRQGFIEKGHDASAALS